MFLIRAITTFLLFVATAASAAAAEKSAVLAFTFAHVDEEKAKVEPFPFFRIFPEGKDKSGADASSSLSALKAARGQSTLFKEEDAKPGLIVVLRRILFIPLDSGDLRAVFEGEFNAVQTTVKKATMDKLLDGHTSEIVFAGETTKGLRPLAFTVKPKTTFRLAIKEGQLLLYGVDGESTIVHYGLTGTFTYESDKVKVEPAKKEMPVYTGRPTPPELKADGEPETLPVIN